MFNRDSSRLALLIVAATLLAGSFVLFACEDETMFTEDEWIGEMTEEGDIRLETEDQTAETLEVANSKSYCPLKSPEQEMAFGWCKIQCMDAGGTHDGCKRSCCRRIAGCPNCD